MSTERAQLVAVANGISRKDDILRPWIARGPTIREDSDAETVARWMQWNDPNGCHTAKLAEAEGFDPYDDERAWEALGDMLADEL